MTTSQQPPNSSDRLNREIEEILEQARKRPVSFQERVEHKRHAIQQNRRTTMTQVRPLGRRVLDISLKVPIATALVLAVIAAYLAPEYGFFATLFALAAIVMVFVPFMMRRPSSDFEDQPRWRGRVISNLPPADGGTGRTWMDGIRRRFGR